MEDCSIQDILTIVDTVYENMSIYHAIVLYDPHDIKFVTTLCQEMRKRDYPIILYDSDTSLQEREALYNDMQNFRIFVVSVQRFTLFLMTWAAFFVNIDFVMLLGRREDLYTNYKHTTYHIRKPQNQLIYVTGSPPTP